jgi:protein SCO1
MKRLARLFICGVLSLFLSRPALALDAGQVGVEERSGATLPGNLTFRSSGGHELELGEAFLAGKPALLVLAYNRCEMLCSLVLRGVADAVRRSRLQPGSDFSLVTLSIDPRETAYEAARTQQALLEAAGYPRQTERWPFLIGDERAIQAVASAVGFKYRWDPQLEQYMHPAVVFALSARGTVQSYMYGLRFEPEQLAAALSSTPPARNSSVAQSILNCFRLPAFGSRYGRVIQVSFQAGALLVLVSLAWGIRQLARRNRTS